MNEFNESESFGKEVSEEAISEEVVSEEAVSEESITEEAPVSEEIPAEESEIEPKPEKKRFPLQKPVIIALCIVLVALLGYLVYTGFLLKEPEGVTWATEINDVTYYIEFNSDGTYNGYFGSVEMTGNYTKEKGQQSEAATSDEAVNSLALDGEYTYFYPGIPFTYEITGSRLLGNQEIKFSYGSDFSFSFYQSSRKKVDLELPKDFQPDDALVGTWVLNYADQELTRITFNADGSAKIVSPQVTINATYTLEPGKVNLTYQGSQSEVYPSEYEVNGDTLTFMNAIYTREGSGATVDQPFLMMNNQQVEEETAAESK